MLEIQVVVLFHSISYHARHFKFSLDDSDRQELLEELMNN